MPRKPSLTIPIANDPEIQARWNAFTASVPVPAADFLNAVHQGLLILNNATPQYKSLIHLLMQAFNKREPQNTSRSSLLGFDDESAHYGVQRFLTAFVQLDAMTPRRAIITRPLLPSLSGPSLPSNEPFWEIVAIPDSTESAFALSEPLPISKLATRFGLNRATMRKYLETGQVRAKKVGQRWRVADDEMPNRD